MLIKHLVNTALYSLRQHKGRSMLTTISIVVGIAAIIATVAIGHGAEEKMRRKILAMGDNFIVIYAGNFFQEGKTTTKKRKKTKALTMQDVDRLHQHIPNIKHVSPVYYGKNTITYGGNTIIAPLRSGNEKSVAILNQKIQAGQMFSATHVTNARRVAVLGSKAAQELFGTNNPLGKTIQIKNKPIMVIGVLAPVKESLGSQNPNLRIFLPITTHKKIIEKLHKPKIHSIALSVANTKKIPRVVRSIRSFFRHLHHLEKNDPDDFTIMDQASMLKAAQESSNILTLFLIIIASMSLLVGGIGVMNIMMVAVSERTREIGIRMALGATGKTIRLQFILEALTLCFLGGILGIFFGILIPFIASWFTGWLVIIKPMVVIGAFFVTTLIGLFFGFYPAHKAANMNPVEALLER